MADWQQLLGDVEAQAEALAEREREGEAQERTRVERARTTLRERFAAGVGDHVQVTLGAAGPVSGRIESVGPDWLLVADPVAGHEHLVLLASISSIADLTDQARPVQASPVLDRLDAAWAIRRLARDRTRVRVRTRDGQSCGGVLDVVGAEHLDLVDDLLGSARGDARHATTVALASIAVISRT